MTYLYVGIGIGALAILWFAFVFITALCERQRLTGDVEPVSEPYPYPKSSYWVVTGKQAAQLGLSHAGDYATKRNTSVVKGLQSLWLSPDCTVIASIVAASFASMPLKKTVLRSRLANGTVIESTDNPGSKDLSRVVNTAVLLNAGIQELFQFHSQRILGSGFAVVPFSHESVLSSFEQIDAERGARLVGMGLARWADPQKSSIRLTFRGSIAHILRNYFQEIGALKGQRQRTGIPRAGSAGN